VSCSSSNASFCPTAPVLQRLRRGFLHQFAYTPTMPVGTSPPSSFGLRLYSCFVASTQNPPGASRSVQQALDAERKACSTSLLPRPPYISLSLLPSPHPHPPHTPRPILFPLPPPCLPPPPLSLSIPFPLFSFPLLSAPSPPSHPPRPGTFLDRRQPGTSNDGEISPRSGL